MIDFNFLSFFLGIVAHCVVELFLGIDFSFGIALVPLVDGVTGGLVPLNCVTGGLVPLEGVTGGLALLNCVTGGLVPLEGVTGGLILVEGVVELLLDMGADGDVESRAGLTAHSMPSFGGQRVDGLLWAHLVTKVTRARLLRFLTYASSSLFLTFVRADLSHGNFLTKYAESLQFPSSSSE